MSTHHQIHPIDVKMLAAWLAADVGTEQSSLLIKILRNANRHTLTTVWDETFAAQPTSELDFGGTTEHFIRHHQAQAFAVATELALGLYQETDTGVSQEVAIERTVRVVTSAARQHCSQRADGWSGPDSWQGAYWAHFLAMAAWLLADDIPAEDQDTVSQILVWEADRFLSYEVPYWQDTDGTNFPGDTKAEENSWNALAVSNAIAMLPEHPHREQWIEKNVELLVSSFARPADLTSTDIVQGRPLAQWLRGWNITDEGLLYNHDIIHPDYVAALVHNLFAPTILALAGDVAPRAALHNMAFLYQHVVDHPYRVADGYEEPGGAMYVPGSGSVYYPEPTDWGTSRRMNFAGMDAMVDALGLDGGASVPAREWLALHGGDALSMQSRFPDGRTYGDADDDRFLGREGWVGSHAAWALLTRLAAVNGAIRLSNGSPAEMHAARNQRLS